MRGGSAKMGGESVEMGGGGQPKILSPPTMGGDKLDGGGQIFEFPPHHHADNGGGTNSNRGEERFCIHLIDVFPEVRKRELPLVNLIFPNLVGCALETKAPIIRSQEARVTTRKSHFP